MKHLELSQEKLDVKKYLEEYLAIKKEATLTQISSDLSRETHLHAVTDQTIDSRIDAQVSSQSFEAMEASKTQEVSFAQRQELASMNLETSRSQAMGNLIQEKDYLNQMLDNEILEQQQMVDNIRFEQMSSFSERLQSLGIESQSSNYLPQDESPLRNARPSGEVRSSTCVALPA
uniref:Uncharacterized protein n=1 Tax=Caulerpa okamurae TaxID=118247 RepID=A0A3S5FWS0_9CHLO|nr:hypothetical protein [Caulerpa okamurae]